jgi:uncharacterized membrane protein
MKNKPTPEQKIAYSEFLEIQHIRNQNLKEQNFIVLMTIGLLAILVLSYVSNVVYVEILMLYLAVIILFLLFRNKKYRRDEKIYSKTLNKIKQKFMDSHKD